MVILPPPNRITPKAPHRRISATRRFPTATRDPRTKPRTDAPHQRRRRRGLEHARNLFAVPRRDERIARDRQGDTLEPIRCGLPKAVARRDHVVAAVHFPQDCVNAVPERAGPDTRERSTPGDWVAPCPGVQPRPPADVPIRAERPVMRLVESALPEPDGRHARPDRGRRRRVVRARRRSQERSGALPPGRARDAPRDDRRQRSRSASPGAPPSSRASPAIVVRAPRAASVRSTNRCARGLARASRDTHSRRLPAIPIVETEQCDVTMGGVSGVVRGRSSRTHDEDPECAQALGSDRGRCARDIRLRPAVRATTPMRTARRSRATRCGRRACGRDRDVRAGSEAPHRTVQERDPRTAAVSRPRAPGRCRNFDRMALRCCAFSQLANRTGRRSSSRSKACPRGCRLRRRI